MHLIFPFTPWSWFFLLCLNLGLIHIFVSLCFNNSHRMIDKCNGKKEEKADCLEYL